MISLRKLQRGLVTAVVSGKATWLDACINAGTGGALALSADERLAIYRNNWQQGFIKALAIGYPVTEQLVGPDYFLFLAREFLAVSPSRRGDLRHIGGPFPEFLRRKFSATEYAYLADVGALEHLCEELQVAAEVTPTTVDELRSIPASDYADMRFDLCPTAGLLHSSYPVAHIWLSNQPQAAPEVIDLRSGGEQLLVRYVEEAFEFHRLRPVEFTLATAFRDGLPLAEALAAATRIAPDFELTEALARLLGAGALQLRTAEARRVSEPVR